MRAVAALIGAILVISLVFWGVGALTSAFTIDPDAVAGSVKHPIDRQLSEADREMRAEISRELDELL